MKIFVTNSNKRVYSGAMEGTYRKVYAAQGEIFAYQVSVYNDCDNLYDAEISVESDCKTNIRLEEYVPIHAHSTITPAEETDGIHEFMVPDVLKETSKISISPYETKTFWIKVSDLKPGEHIDKVKVVSDINKLYSVEVNYSEDTLEVPYFVSDFKIEKHKTIPTLHWFYADSISAYYKLPLWSDVFWAMCKKWMQNYAAHGMTHIYLPLFTPPLDGVKMPTQLLDVKIIEGEKENAKYAFDFTNASKWVNLAKECGINNFECVHLFTQWGELHPLRIYKDTKFNLCPTNIKLYDRDITIGSKEDKENLLVDIEKDTTNPEYKNFLTQFFAALKPFCEEHGIYDNIWFHVSDEPHIDHLDIYRRASDMLKELKPDIKILDALSNREFADHTQIDMPIPGLEDAEPFEDIVHGVYFCCFPRGKYINRLLDTPLFKTRMLGALMYKKNASFFLHWGYNYYFISQTRDLIDPYVKNDGGQYPNWAPGDCFQVYPGPEGPLDSIRWENFYDTLQDYDLLTNLNFDKKSDLLKDLKTYAEFPRDPDFIWDLREKLLK